MVAVQADCSVVSKLESETLSSVHSYTICAAKSSVFVNVDDSRLVKNFCKKVRQMACSSRDVKLLELLDEVLEQLDVVGVQI